MTRECSTGYNRVLTRLTMVRVGKGIPAGPERLRKASRLDAQSDWRRNPARTRASPLGPCESDSRRIRWPPLPNR
jgi:hypothetical protein